MLIAPAPDGLIEKLKRRRRITETNSASQHRVISDELLAELLSHFDPNDYSGYDPWLIIAMASHSATGGSGFHEFHQWCMDGDAYSSEERVQQQWDSFDANEAEGVTIGTLFKAVEDARELMEPSESAAAQATLHKVKAEIEFAGIDTEKLVRDNLTEDEIEELPEKMTPIDIHLSGDLEHDRLRILKRIGRHLPKVLQSNGVFVRSSVLVEVSVDADPSDPESRQLQFRAVSEQKLAAILSSFFQFLKTKENDEGLAQTRRVAIPGWLPKTVLTYGVYSNCDEIRDVTQTPTLLPDGRIVSEPGLDRESGLYLNPEPGFLMPPIPEQPTKSEADAAWACLKSLVPDFPFEHLSHVAAWLSMLMTMLIRRSILAPCPLFLVTGNRKGIGKSLLTHLASLIAHAQEFTSTYPKSDEECRKRLAAKIAAKTPVEAFDNIPNDGSFGHPSLDAVLTGGTFYDRMLGKSETIGGRVATTFVASGNNTPIDPTTDLSRRLVVVALDHASATDPTTRTDFSLGNEDELKAHIRKNRGELVAACFTLLRAYEQSGEQLQLRGFGSYAVWSKAVRETVTWITGHDPCDGILNTAAAVGPDSGADHKAIVLEAFRDAIEYCTKMATVQRPAGLPADWTPNDGLTVGELQLLYDEHRSMLPESVRTAFSEVLDPEMRANGRSIGRKVASNARVVVKDERLVQSKNTARRAWRIESLNRSSA